MIYLLTTLHILACLVLIAVVLLQSGKRADLAGAFGGGGSQTAFGARGAATFLSKATTGMAILFMVTSITLAIMSSRRAGGSQSVLEGAPASQSAPAPAGDSGGLPPLPADSTGAGSNDDLVPTDDGATDETPAP